MKRVVCLFLTLCILFCTVSTSAVEVAPADRYAANNSLNISEDFLENSYAAAVAYTNFIMALNNTQSSSTISSASDKALSDNAIGYKINGIGSGGYPDYYAGAYINTYGNLVVLMDESQSYARTVSATSELQELTQSDDFIVGHAKYTYNQLIDVMSEILAYQANVIESEIEDQYYITGFGIDDYANRVVVYINSIDDPAIEWFKENITNSAAVEFVMQDTYSEPTATANYGEGISANGSGFSIGFRAKYTNSIGTVIKGFVTCGHAFTPLSSPTVYYNGQIFGGVDSSRIQYQNGGYSDAAFVRIYDGSEVNAKVVTNTGVTYSISTTGGWILPPQYSNVYMYGKASASEYGSVRIGQITSVSHTAQYDKNGDGAIDFYLNDQVLTSYTSLKGDSGGVVFALSSGVFYVSGVQSGHYTREENGAEVVTSSFYSKALNFMNSFGLSLY